MSNNSSHDDETVARATTVHASKGGNAGKWLLGGLVAVVLAGAGYMAWKNSATSPAATQSAHNDPYAADTEHAGPLPATQSVTTENPASPDPTATPSPARSAAVTKPAHRATTRTASVPEATIGVTPAGASTEDFAASDESVIVHASSQPVWTRMPSPRRLSALYPVMAQEQGREGEAELHCTVLQNGALNCQSVSETRGFGNAALRVANTLRHAPQFADGSDAVGSPLNLRVVFRLPPDVRRG